jgi:hypothetical protein
MDDFLESWINVETYVKLALVAATYQLWGPVLKTIVREIKLATLVPRGSLIDKLPPVPPPRAPGDDPWITVPLAAHRSRSARQEPRAAESVRRRSGPPKRRGFGPGPRGF